MSVRVWRSALYEKKIWRVIDPQVVVEHVVVARVEPVLGSCLWVENHIKAFRTLGTKRPIPASKNEPILRDGKRVSPFEE